MGNNKITEFRVDAYLCDSVVAAEGKLYVQGGGWNFLSSTEFPFRQSRIGLGMIVTVPYTATNQNHTLEIRLEDEDHNQISIGQPAPGADGKPGQIEAKFNIGRPPILHPGDAQNVPFAVNIDQLEFMSPGAYAFVLSIDGTEVNRLVFRVMGLPDRNIST